MESIVIPLYNWNLNDIGIRRTVDLVWLTVDPDNSSRLDVHTLSFKPFARDQLLEIMQREIGGSARVVEYERGHYWVVATKTDSAGA